MQDAEAYVDNDEDEQAVVEEDLSSMRGKGITNNRHGMQYAQGVSLGSQGLVRANGAAYGAQSGAGQGLDNANNNWKCKLWACA